MDGTNAQCCLDKGVADALHCAWYMWKDMVYYSENHGAKYTTKAIMPKSASLTQNMNIVHLKTHRCFDKGGPGGSRQVRKTEHRLAYVPLFLLYPHLYQAMGLNLMLGQAGQFHWSFLVFDGIILLMFAAAMKMVFLKNWHPEGQGQPVKIKTMWKVCLSHAAQHRHRAGRGRGYCKGGWGGLAVNPPLLHWGVFQQCGTLRSADVIVLPA